MAISSLETQTSQLENLELFLLNLRYKEGRLIDAEGHQPVLLDDPTHAWVVYSGSIDVFAVTMQDGEICGARRHLFRGRAGQLLLGIAPHAQDRGVRLLARGTTGTRLLCLKQARLWELGSELEYTNLVAAMGASWVLGLGQGLAQGLLPKDALLLEAGQEYQLVAQQATLPARGLLWAKPYGGSLHIGANPDLDWTPNDGYVPLSRELWAQATSTMRLTTLSNEEMLQTAWIGASITHFHRLVMAALADALEQATIHDAALWRERLEAERAVMEQALARLHQPLVDHADNRVQGRGDHHNALLEACRIIGNSLNIDITLPPGATKSQTLGAALKTIARFSQVRMREVALRGQWWRADHGPLLAFYAETQRPVVLLPRGAGSYELRDPVESTTVRVTRDLAATLLPLAYMFYRPFPKQPLTAWKLIKFGVQGCKRDLLLVAFVGCLLGLLGLVPPIALGMIFNTIVPTGQMALLLQMGLALLLVALVGGVLQIVRGLLLLRVQTRMDASLQAAIWDRLLSLPVPFFRNFTAGALGARAMGISEIRRMLSGHIITTVLNSIFSVFNLALLFYYAPSLALVAVLLVVVALALTFGIAMTYLRYQRVLQDAQNEVAGTVLQLLRGVIKIRVAGAENHAFALWSERFAAQKSVYYKARSVSNLLMIYNAAYPLMALLLIFALLAFAQQFAISTASFLSFNLAFAQFLGAWFLLGSMLIYILPVFTTYERLRPILDAQPEVSDAKLEPGELTGKLEVSRVSFRYNEQSPLVLNDVSLEIKPGEFVALVGPSGSGKSSLFRLLLGFEYPEAGVIYYDDQNLADLDVRAVRSQIGVVLQHAALMPGDIYSNIVGAAPNLTIDDAWEAARMVGMEEEIRALPMGMHTIISEGGGNFSGGQRQRLLIARALVNRPRILFFDEATSALDNRTQDIVSRSLETLQATRVVIAHRLSTIMKADRIYVFDKGRIVQVGTYTELINTPGQFAELARRQMV